MDDAAHSNTQPIKQNTAILIDRNRNHQLFSVNSINHSIISPHDAQNRKNAPSQDIKTKILAETMKNFSLLTLLIELVAFPEHCRTVGQDVFDRELKTLSITTSSNSRQYF